MTDDLPPEPWCFVGAPRQPKEIHVTPHFLANAKAYVALVGSIASALLGVYAADTPVGQVLTVITVIATAVGTWTVPNTPSSDRAIP